LLNTVAVLESPLALVPPAPAPPARDDRVVDRDWRRPAPSAFLVRRGLDTWLVGGLSLAVFAVVAALWPLSGAVPSIGTQLRNLALIAPTLALFINYPHFVASYRLAYWRRDAATRHPLVLVFLPVALLVAMLLAFLTFDARVVVAGHTIESFGSRLAGWLVAFMFLTVGWHYVKQAYGCSRVGARLRGFPIPAGRARILRYSMFPLWVAVWARGNAGHETFDYAGVRYGSLGLPRWVIPVTNIGIVVGVIAAAWVFATSWRSNRTVPPLLVVTPIVAMFVWWIPAAFNPTFFVLIPMFHSLQYLPFAAGVERGRTAARHPERRALRRRLALTAGALVIGGWMVFEIGPDLLDSATGSAAHLGLLFFTAMIPVLINIHHYFIDHVIWRAGEPEVFTHLVAAPAPRP